jgi:hypothetical protein
MVKINDASENGPSTEPIISDDATICSSNGVLPINRIIVLQPRI